MYAIPFWNTNEKDDLEENFVLLAASEKRGIEIIKELAHKENRKYKFFVCEAKEWVVSEVANYSYSKNMVEWCEETTETSETIEINPRESDFF